MIASLMIHNLALIEDLELEFSPGLNIVTGETGAGKSIILGAIQMLLGQRADRTRIRRDATSCSVSAIYELAGRPELIAELNQLLEPSGCPPCEQGQLLLRRVITEKTNRNYVNGCPVNLSTLRDLGNLLVDMHGPYDHQSLFDVRRQLQALDTFTGAQLARASCATAYAACQTAQRALEHWERNAPNPAQLENMRYQLDEIEAANLNPDEVAELSHTHSVASNASQLVGILDRCRTALDEDDDAVLQQFGSMMRDLQDVAEIDDQRGPVLIELLEAAIAHTQAFQEELTVVVGQLELDPFALQAIEERLSVVHGLLRKYGPTVERVQEFAAKLRTDLASYDDAEQTRQELQHAVTDAESAHLQIAKKLGKARRKAAPGLATQITDKLKVLGFKDCQFDLAFTDAPPAATGIDRVEFRFAPNPGEGAHNLREIASSGEIARVMLALKTVLAAADRIPVLIFDEIDANIGGTTAAAVGREMARLGGERQILCITHTPQVAAGGSRHFRVQKHVTSQRTHAEVSILKSTEKIDEVARMLGSTDNSCVVKDHARELIKMAKAAS